MHCLSIFLFLPFAFLFQRVIRPFQFILLNIIMKYFSSIPLSPCNLSLNNCFITKNFLTIPKFKKKHVFLYIPLINKIYLEYLQESLHHWVSFSSDFRDFYNPSHVSSEIIYVERFFIFLLLLFVLLCPTSTWPSFSTTILLLWHRF